MRQLEAQNVWEQVCANLSTRQETNNPMARAYISYLSPANLDDTSLTVVTRLASAKKGIEERYISHIDSAITSILGGNRKLTILVSEDDAEEARAQAHHASQPLHITNTSSVDTLVADAAVTPTPNYRTPENRLAPVSTATLLAAPAGIPTSTAITTPTNLLSFAASPPASSEPVMLPMPQNKQLELRKKTFATFVVGESNDFAFSAAQGVSEMPGVRFNPLFVYGRSGLGKTHLLLAIKDYINYYHPTHKVIFAQTSEFVNDFTSAMASVARDLTDFRYKYYSCDVLLLDDVQYLEGKESTTNALFDIFNLFTSQQKQIVLSADRAPNEINLDERFTSRFSQGITAGIQPPDFEMKMAIFNKLTNYYCQQFGFDAIAIPQNVSDYVINISSSNIRELEGAASSLVGYIATQRKGTNTYSAITVEEAEQVVGRVFLHNTMKKIDIQAIQKEVATFFNITTAEMLGPRRSKEISYPRQVAMYLSRRLTTKSFPEIGKMFGGKDHTSVMYAYSNIEKKMMEDSSKKIEVERLAQVITS